MFDGDDSLGTFLTESSILNEEESKEIQEFSEIKLDPKFWSQVVQIWSTPEHSNAIVHIRDFQNTEKILGTDIFGHIYEFIYTKNKSENKYAFRKWDYK